MKAEPPCCAAEQRVLFCAAYTYAHAHLQEAHAKGNMCNLHDFSTALMLPQILHLLLCAHIGCTTVRLLQIEKEKKNHTKPPTSLKGQLLWREFFYTVGGATKNFDKMEGNPICRQIDWDDNQEFFKAWEEARTGYPWIDAIMVQLRQEGWMHHLARHAVACFLTRGDLYCHWEKGRDVFDRLLIDADWHVNNGNWMWLSASAFFHQFFRVYSPVSFGKKYDKNGDFIRHYLPVLKVRLHLPFIDCLPDNIGRDSCEQI